MLCYFFLSKLIIMNIMKLIWLKIICFDLHLFTNKMWFTASCGFFFEFHNAFSPKFRLFMRDVGLDMYNFTMRNWEDYRLLHNNFVYKMRTCYFRLIYQIIISYRIIIYLALFCCIWRYFVVFVANIVLYLGILFGFIGNLL